VGIRLVTIAVALLALAIPVRAVAAAGAVEAGKITVNRSIAGVWVGAERPAVVAEIGPPLTEYGPDEWAWDGDDSHFGVAFADDAVVRVSVGGSGRFCIRSGVCIGSRGGVGYLRRRYGRRLRFLRVEDGSLAAIVTERAGGRKVFTIFGHLTSAKASGRFRSVMLGDCARGVSRPC
jgi:hypothetical protein